MLSAWLITPPSFLVGVVCHALSFIIYQLSFNNPHLKNKEPLMWITGIGEMNIFSSLRQYAGKWQLKSSRDFSQEEIAAVERNEVVSSQYGNSVCFFMAGGGMTFIPLSNNSTVGVGESIDLQRAKLLTLSKSGEDDILRVEA